MRETFKVGQHVRLVSGGGCDAANGFTDGDICEVESKGNAGKYDLRIRGLTHRTIGYVNADQLEALTPTLDETTNPADVEWGEVRSAVAAKDWRRAWEVVGTDHTGEATPGEAYIFGNARRLACVSAALFHWRAEYSALLASRWQAVQAGQPEPFAPYSDVAWPRIKTIAAWESSAAAQYVKRAPARYNFRSSEVRINGQVIGGYDASPTGDYTAVYYDETSTREDYDRLRARQSARQGINFDGVDESPPRGVTGLFRNPWIPPMQGSDADDALVALRALVRATTAERSSIPLHGGSETYTLTLNGERQTYTVPASSATGIVDALRGLNATARDAGAAIARIASGNAAISTNPAPHGPTRRRRR